MKTYVGLVIATAFMCGVGFAEDYASYIKTSKDYKPVKQFTQAEMDKHWPAWTLMPWRAGWAKKFDPKLAQEMASWGYNGAFQDYVPKDDISPALDQYNLRWYCDHMAGKGDLHLTKSRSKNLNEAQKSGLIRPNSLMDPQIYNRMKQRLTGAVKKSLKYKSRLAYAFDDEVSWAIFTTPVRWDNHPNSLADYSSWLKKRYGSEKALMEQWGSLGSKFVNKGQLGKRQYVKRMVHPDDLIPQWKQPMDTWNLSAWCDSASYMDSQFNNIVGDLTDVANGIDPSTPAGFVGGHAPAPFGGSDYTKVTKKLQFIEAYDIGGSMEIVRSMNPENRIATVKTVFGQPASDKVVWENWHFMIHGDRGGIYWADKWFSDQVPEATVKKYGAEVARIAEKSKLYQGKTWKHDGVALYYSHPSIQVSWFIDVEPHGSTWINRKSSLNNKLASSIGTTWAWQKILEDMHVQYNWLGYDNVVANGIDLNEYKVVILPRVLALSDEEAAALRKFVKDGGVLIADHMPGVFDHHGKARADSKGALDDVFGVDRPRLTRGSLFTGKVWSEYNQETYWKLNFITAGQKEWPLCKRDSNGFIVAQRDMPTMQSNSFGKGHAFHMNTSVIEYCAVRDEVKKATAYRNAIQGMLDKGDVKSPVQVLVDGKPAPNTEVTYWEKDNQWVVSVNSNPIRLADEYGNKKFFGNSPKTKQVTVVFDKAGKNAVDQMSGKSLKSGKSFTLNWEQPRAAIMTVEF